MNTHFFRSHYIFNYKNTQSINISIMEAIKKSTTSIEMIEVSVACPTRKPDERIKGSLCKWFDTGYITSGVIYSSYWCR